MADKNRYSDAELQEFREIIQRKLEKAREDYELLKSAITQSESNDTQDTSPTFKVLEEGAATLSKEEAGRLAQRQQKFIQHLQVIIVLHLFQLTIAVKRNAGLYMPLAPVLVFFETHVGQVRSSFVKDTNDLEA